MFFYEAYFGKSKEIGTLERSLSTYRSKYFGQYFNATSYVDDNLRNFEKLVENTFGFSVFDLTIVNSRVMNAFTLPLGMKFDVWDPRKYVISSSQGFKFKKEAKYACIVSIYSGIIFNPAFTDAEVLAIILHEIGHNFQDALNGGLGILTKYHKALAIPSYLLRLVKDPKKAEVIADILNSSNTVNRESKNLTNYLTSCSPIFAFGSDFVHTVADIVSSIPAAGAEIASVFTLGIFNVLISAASCIISLNTAVKNPLAYIAMIPINTKNKMGEQIADNFVTMYGYGPALTSALQKMDDTKADPRVIAGFVSRMPVLGKIYKMNTDVASIIFGFVDSHPATYKRVEDQIYMLEHELEKSDLKPEMKTRIKSDLKEIKDEVEAYKNTGKSSNNFLHRAYYRWLAENSTGKMSTEYAQASMRYNEYDDIFNKVKLQ